MTTSPNQTECPKPAGQTLEEKYESALSIIDQLSATVQRLSTQPKPEPTQVAAPKSALAEYESLKQREKKGEIAGGSAFAFFRKNKRAIQSESTPLRGAKRLPSGAILHRG